MKVSDLRHDGCYLTNETEESFGEEDGGGAAVFGTW
jgi:hypothetical protein